MHNMLRRMREERAEGDRGFTLIELLVVVVIIGILVAIAIPIYLHYTNGAKNKSAESDARSAVTTIEQCVADNNGTVYSQSGWPSAAKTGDSALTVTCDASGDTEVFVVSSGNELTVTFQNATTYTVDVTSPTGDTYEYNSATGQLGKTSGS